MVKKVIMNLDLSMASGADCISLVVFKNCEPECLCIQYVSELFNMCLKESCFSDYWKVSLVVPVFKNVEERSTDKNYHHVSPLFAVSKAFEELVNNWLVNHREKCGVFSDSQYSIRSFRSTAGLRLLEL